MDIDIHLKNRRHISMVVKLENMCVMLVIKLRFELCLRFEFFLLNILRLQKTLKS